MRRLSVLLIALAMAAGASAQVTLSTVEAGVVTAAGAGQPFGPVALGSTASVVFRLTNTGGSAVYLTSLAVSGEYASEFTIACPVSPQLCASAQTQQLPILINPTGTLDFTIQFEPFQLGSPSVTLTINAGSGISIILFGSGVPGLTALINNQPLGAGETVNFGNVAVGSSQTIKITLENPPTNVALGVPVIAALAAPYSLAGSALAQPTVSPGGSVALDVTFTPASNGAQQATLTIGLLTYPLLGTGTAAPPQTFPVPSIRMTLAAPVSGMQGSLSVTLASAPVLSGAGTVTLAFQPAITGVNDDPTITFEDGTRSAAFTVTEGSTEASFSDGPTVAFETGTTAGTLVFSATLGSKSAQSTIAIPPAVIGIGTATAARNVACAPSIVYCTTSNIEIQVNGWDNTRSAGELTFSFYDSNGNGIATGIAVNAASAFEQYFSASALGGVFGMDALFPVNPNIADTVATAVVQLTNGAGTVESSQITF